MNEPGNDDRLIRELAATLREPPDDELARGLGEAIDPGLRERLFEMMQTSRVSAPTPMPTRAANDAGRRWLIVGGMLAAAAAVALVWVWQSQPRPEPEVPRIALAPVPNYEFATDGGLALERSDNTPPASELQYRSNNQFTWIGRPATNFEAVVGVRVCARSANGEVVEIDVAPFLEIAPESGAVHLQGRVAALGLSPGHWTVAIAVGHEQVIAEIDSVCRLDEAEGMVIDRVELQLLED